MVEADNHVLDVVQFLVLWMTPAAMHLRLPARSGVMPANRAFASILSRA